MAITDRTLQSIKAAPLSKVIEALGGGLKRVGHEFLTQCPWHDDTNPSLTVNDQKGFCYCHVCREGGDAVKYTQKVKGMRFPEAAEFTAAILGVRFETDDEDPEVTARRKAEREAELDKNKKTQAEFRENWQDERCGRVRQQWLDRGLTPEASREFGIGFTPSGFFAGRITVPIHDHYNNLVGWTGRATKEEQDAKYKNSPDSAVFRKKTLVFNEPRGLEAAKESGCIIFVEGHLDVVSMWQAGIRNVVAMQGTGAPEKFVLERLARSVKNFVLCFDGDAGGVKATEQFISVGGPMAVNGEININVVTLPEKTDPDEVIRSGGDLYSYIASAPSWLDWTIDTWAASLDLDDGAMVIQVERQLQNLIDKLQSQALRTHYIDKAARVLSNNSKEAREIVKSWGVRPVSSSSVQWTPREPHEIRLAVERRMVRVFVHKPEQRDALRPLLSKVQNPALRWLCERLRELEEHSMVDLTPHSVMAVVAVAEPHYMAQVRTLIRPNVTVDDSEGVLAHIHDILSAEPSNQNTNATPQAAIERV